MRYFWFLAASAVFIVGCSKSGTEPNDQTKSPESASPAIVADVVYNNGIIYTVNKAQPWAEAMAIKDGKFIAVGSAEEVEAVTGDGTEVVDLAGRMAMPGLVDTHNHMTAASVSKANLMLSNPNDLDAMLAEIKAFAEENPDLGYIRGEAWNLGVFLNDSPTKDLLDEIVPDRPTHFGEVSHVYVLVDRDHYLRQ